MCLLSLMIIVVHVILLDKILISYCLNYKNLTEIVLDTKEFDEKIDVVDVED